MPVPAPLPSEVLDEDLQIILATLATLSPHLRHAAPSSRRALEEASERLAEVRAALVSDQAQDEPTDQLSFPDLELSGPGVASRHHALTGAWTAPGG